MRRDSNDEKWQECKRKVREMDRGHCLLCDALTIKEVAQFRNSNIDMSTQQIDPAHYKAVSQRQDLMYDPNNVFSLCRVMHERIDHGRDPVTGDFCKPDVAEYWWQRIIAQRKAMISKEENSFENIFFDGEDEEPENMSLGGGENEFFFGD